LGGQDQPSQSGDGITVQLESIWQQNDKVRFSHWSFNRVRKADQPKRNGRCPELLRLKCADQALAMGRFNRCRSILPARKEFSGQVAGWSFRGLKPWQAGADEIREIRGITRLNGSFVN
jgi:hypothetical protein